MVERTREYFGNNNTLEFQAWLGFAHRHAASRLQFTRLFLHQPPPEHQPSKRNTPTIHRQAED
jgi:hypothetical protein